MSRGHLNRTHLTAAMKKLAHEFGMHLPAESKSLEVAQAVAMVTNQKLPAHHSHYGDMILIFLEPPREPVAPRPFQPLKQSRAMEIANSRCRPDFSPVSISSRVTDTWRR